MTSREQGRIGMAQTFLSDMTNKQLVGDRDPAKVETLGEVVDLSWLYGETS